MINLSSSPAEISVLCYEKRRSKGYFSRLKKERMKGAKKNSAIEGKEQKKEGEKKLKKKNEEARQSQYLGNRKCQLLVRCPGGGGGVGVSNKKRTEVYIGVCLPGVQCRTLI